jgi:hypothetical protein
VNHWRDFATLGIVIIGAATACAMQTPPPPPEPVDVHVRAPFDTVWSRAIGFMSTARIGVQTTDRQSGLITSGVRDISWQQLREWANCGNSGGRTIQAMDDNEMRAKNVQGRGSLEVVIRPVGDSTVVRPTVTISATWTNPMLGQQAARFECVSNGGLEYALIGALRR